MRRNFWCRDSIKNKKNTRIFTKSFKIGVYIHMLYILSFDHTLKGVYPQIFDISQ